MPGFKIWIKLPERLFMQRQQLVSPERRNM